MNEDNSRHPLVTLVWVLLTITALITILATFLTNFTIAT